MSGADGVLSAAAAGGVVIALPAPIGMVVTLQHVKLASPSDAASAAPINLPTVAYVTVVVHYDDGTSRDITDDPRTSIVVSEGTTLARKEEGASRVVARAVTPGGGSAYGSVTVQAAFLLSATQSVTGSASLLVVGLQEVALQTSAHPSFSGSDGVSKSTLFRVQCTSSYQRARATFTALLTDGQTFDVTAHTVVRCSNSSGLDVQGTILIPATAGTYQVKGIFRGVASREANVTVSEQVAALTVLAFSTAWPGGSSEPTFNAVQNSSQTLHVSGVFDDGTEMKDLVAGAQSSWIPPSELVNFSTNNTGALSVDVDGVATIISNAPHPVLLRAQALCATGAITHLPSAEDTVFANLAPAVNDVDMGNRLGAQFATASTSDPFNVPLRINLGPTTLNLFNLLVEYDPVYLTATDCQPGTDWAAYSFTCTIGDPPGEILLTGTEMATPLSGVVEIAVFTLQSNAGVIASSGNASTSIFGTVNGLDTSAARFSIADGSIYPFIAGQGSMHLQPGEASEAGSSVGGERRLHSTGHAAAPWLRSPRDCDGSFRGEIIDAGGPDKKTVNSCASWRPTASQWSSGGHHLAQTQEEVAVLGDVNGDGVFDTFDAQDIKKWVAAVPGYTDPTRLSEFQRRQLDPTLDFLTAPEGTGNCPPGWAYGTPCPSLKDSQFLIYVYANFLRFLKLDDFDELAAAVRAPATPADVLQLRAHIFDAQGRAVEGGGAVQVFFEVNTVTANVDMEAAAAYAATTVNRSMDGTVLISAYCNNSDGRGHFCIIDNL
ncbi:hypothetical protein CYMTET_27413 [Cymbomonas tetramitiformis]|uniref:Uncharacterized protein n=1 Tax=Cymbomonas tetramitiformis TaxID=36881 RepID=A0AAE0KX14_9CHLO|nr:hypothetical protein CYMTET_27413 [Cymbomonas tetramitiformis]